MTTERLLAMFPPVPTEQWEKIVREAVPGPDYAAKLIWHPEEALAIKPYYRAEDLSGLSFTDAGLGEFPFVRGSRTQGGWLIQEEIDVVDPEEANQRALEALGAGAEGISFTRTRIESQSDIALLLADLSDFPVHIANASRHSARLLCEWLKRHPHASGLSADIDPLADTELSTEIIALPGFRPFLIDAAEFHESAAGAIEEVAFALSAGVEFLAAMRDRGCEIDRLAESISFHFAMGPEFFIQIAKLRSFRMVWAQVLESFGGNHEHAKAVIQASPSRWNMTVYDRHVNVLRSTNAAIGAILGGADSISIPPFDECCRPPDPNSRRLARNLQIILKREALFDRVADPLGGSYLIEVLTNSIATKAWKQFQELESTGGYRKAKDAGIIASVLSRRAKARDEAVASRSTVLTGTNRFADIAERTADLADRLRTDSPRVSKRFEVLRQRTEAYAADHDRLPLILIAQIGDVKMRSLRSQFAADFLACAGLLVDVQTFETAEQIRAAMADLVVLCSSDAEYLPVAQELVPALRGQGNGIKVVVAGNPATAEQLRDLGVIEFIHLRSNAIEVLSRLQEQLGIKDQ